MSCKRPDRALSNTSIIHSTDTIAIDTCMNVDLSRIDPDSPNRDRFNWSTESRRRNENHRRGLCTYPSRKSNKRLIPNHSALIFDECRDFDRRLINRQQKRTSTIDRLRRTSTIDRLRRTSTIDRLRRTSTIDRLRRTSTIDRSVEITDAVRSINRRWTIKILLS